MNLTWLEQFKDPYINKDVGKGVFLSGVVLGFVASCQNGKGSKINDSPLFKKLAFGKLQKRDLKRHLADIPMMLKAYGDNIPYNREVIDISRTAGELLLSGVEDLGVDGNFLFSTAFLNAWSYFYKICDHIKPKEKVSANEEVQNELQTSA